MDKHRKKNMAVITQLLQWHAAEGYDFLLNIMTDYESWFHDFDPETKQQSIKWHHIAAPKNQARTMPLTSKVIRTVFWDAKGFILVDLLLKGETINMAHYVQTLKKMKCALHESAL
jgi:hypothetical protein